MGAVTAVGFGKRFPSYMPCVVYAACAAASLWEHKKTKFRLVILRMHMRFVQCCAHSTVLTWHTCRGAACKTAGCPLYAALPGLISPVVVPQLTHVP
jgi:hypothetical protein